LNREKAPPLRGTPHRARPKADRRRSAANSPVLFSAAFVNLLTLLGGRHHEKRRFFERYRYSDDFWRRHRHTYGYLDADTGGVPYGGYADEHALRRGAADAGVRF